MKAVLISIQPGWRKASDVAEEIFEQIDDTMDLVCAMTGVNICLFARYAELRKMFLEDSDGQQRPGRALAAGDKHCAPTPKDVMEGAKVEV